MEEKKTAQADLVPSRGGTALVPVEDTLGYWGKNARRLRALSRVLLLVLVVFLIVFTTLNYRAFSPLNIYYFGQDLKSLPTQVGGGAKTLYYDYGGEGAAVVAYRGGAAVAGRESVKIYATDGALLLSMALDKPMTAPRAAVSRDYLIVYDFGSTDYLVFNAHDLLFTGESEAPILGVGLSDAGCFSLIVASDKSLSAVELFDAGFGHTHTFGRASATVAAPLSGDGRTLALVGATNEGAVVDFITFGEMEPRASVTFEGFPLAADFTRDGVLSVLTTKGLFTVTTMGKTLDTVDFAGATPTAYEISGEGAVVALLENTLTGASRVITVNRRGKLQSEVTMPTEVTAVCVDDRYVYALSGETATVYERKKGAVKTSMPISTGYLGVSPTENGVARVFYPAVALPLSAKEWI